MKMLSIFSSRVLAVLLAASSVVAGSGSVNPYADASYTLISRSQPPAGWRLTGRPSPSSLLTLRIALSQPNFHVLESHLLEISDPTNARWRDHLSKEEVDALVAPSDDALSVVDAWLEAYGVNVHVQRDTEQTIAKDWIVVKNVSVLKAEQMLNTTYGIYTHDTTGKRLVRTTEYRLPESVAAHVDVVQPTDYFGTGPKPQVKGVEFGNAKLDKENAAAATFNLTLAQLKDLYGITGYKASGKKSLLGVTGYLEQYANLADLKEFYQLYLPQAANSTLKVELVNGANNSQAPADAGVEANLDTQFAGGVSYPIPNIFYSTYGRGQNTQPNISYEDNGNEPYDVFLLHLLSKPTSQLPQTLTTSYAEGESDVPLNYARKVCALYAQIGARGVSALHSSGDGGAGNGSPTEPCGTPNHLPALFPPSCPYVTAVGATYLIPETAVAFSGGGFSDYFTRPLYQESKVEPYLKSIGKTYAGLYTKTGRAVPDVAAQGYRFEIVYEGKVGHVSGTSASTPAFAGVVALLNDALTSKGKKPLGFLNPWIYSLKAGFNDITTGSNPGCGTPGWNATKGWDPVTGRGTPDFPALLKQLKL